jgi:hypothetical protein
MLSLYKSKAEKEKATAALAGLKSKLFVPMMPSEKDPNDQKIAPAIVI